jgi:pimeloyl-ACP methyl ester carboxylesterase
MDFNDLTKFISLTYTELDEGMNVELKPGHVDIEKLNYVADKNSNNVIDTESFYNIDLNSIYYEYPGAIFNSYENLNNLKIYENSNENSHSLFSNIKNKIFKIFHLDNDKDGIVFWNDPDDDNDGISDKQESDPIDLDVYTGLGKDKIQSSVISSIYNKYNPNKNDDYIIVVGGFGGDTHDVKNSILMKNLEDNKYPWSKMAWFSWNGPGTEHNAYESQKDYEKFRNSMIEYLDEIPDGEKTDLIGYSNGGRLELEFVLDKRNKKCMDKIDKLITINSPIKGTNSKLSKLQRDPFIKKLYGFLLPDLNWLPFPEIDPESPALYNLSSYSPSSLKLAYPDKYGNKNDDGSLYRPNVEIINIASRWDLVVEDFGIKNQIYKYADKVYINYEAILPSHFFNLRDKDTLELILNILNHNKIDKEITKEGYIIYGKEDYSEFYNVYKGEI